RHLSTPVESASGVIAAVCAGSDREDRKREMSGADVKDRAAGHYRGCDESVYAVIQGAHADASCAWRGSLAGRNQSAGLTLRDVASSIRIIVSRSGKRLPVAQRWTVTCETPSLSAKAL